MSNALTLVDLVSLAGGASDAFIVRSLESAGYAGLRVRHGYVFQRLLVAPLSITALARDLGVTQQAMSKTIAELSALGYIEASPDAADARRRSISLSHHGRDAVRAARDIRARLERRIADAVGDDRLRGARETVEVLLAEVGLADRVAGREVPIPGPAD
ncbi:MarR family winged helix-turn-helix transcriptional regulator [Microbacterium pumilum]|uniref:MarR family transcriptional regulator n=1 Tax=Microbacterium pumilum TaxID=344165 RepID=A0ABP5DV71_9MICO